VSPRPIPLRDAAYSGIKAAIFDFQLLPGDRFTEAEMAERLGVSRTPVREALYRLQTEGLVQVAFRAGWGVAPFDFRKLEDLYDLRIVLETHAIERICAADPMPTLAELREFWLVPAAERLQDVRVANADERFHTALVEASGNAEMARVHQEVTEGIRIVRRLDFTRQPRIDATYDEHAKILRAVMRRKADPACALLKTHIDASKAEVRKITLHKLHEARALAHQGSAAKAGALKAA
jgi:DNA-binding GntR family transcriptional regulator